MYPGAVDPLAAFVILATAGAGVVWLATRTARQTRTGWLLVVIYAAFVLSVVFFPLPVTLEAIELGRWREQRGLGPANNLEPFHTLRSAWGGRDFVKQVMGNLALLAPLGVIAGILLPRWSVRSGVLLLSAVVVGIESAQYVMTLAFGFRFRSFDVDDLWLNALGGLLGLTVARVLVRVAPSMREWCRIHRLLLVPQGGDSSATSNDGRVAATVGPPEHGQG